MIFVFQNYPFQFILSIFFGITLSLSTYKDNQNQHAFPILFIHDRTVRALYWNIGFIKPL